MSQISQKSISGITSITTPAGIDNQFTLHTNDTSQAAKLDNAGNFHFSNHVNTTGITSASNFKTGSSDLHSSGLTVGDSFVHSTGINIGSNIKFGSTGVITATSFVGDGSDLTNLPAGLGTALSSTQTDPLNKLYYTNQVLGVGATITVDPPASSSKAYTQYADIKVDSDADLIIAEGDDLIPDVLGLADFGNFGGGASAGRIRVNSITNAAANGATTIQNGVVISGMTTITGGLSIGGTITYEDVTNIDSIGIITARSGVDVDDFISVGSNIHLGNAGVCTATTFSGSGASLTNLPSGQLTGALPAIDGSNLTGIAADKIFEGNTEAEVVDTGSDGHFKVTTEGSERFRIDSNGYVMIGTTTEGHAAGDNLTVADSGNSGITIRSGSSNNGVIYFSDGTSGAAEYRGAVQYNHSDNYLRFYTNGNEKLRITSGGHMGLGVTPNANWPTNADFKALQIGTGACLFGRGSGDEDRGGIAVNWYTDGSNNKYIGNGNAARIYLADGNIYFSTAGANSSGANAAMTLNDRMILSSSGRLGIAGFQHNYTMNSQSTDLVIGNGGSGRGITLWTASAADNQTISFQTNETLSRAEGEISYGPTGTSTVADRNAMMFRTNSAERFRIDKNGTLTNTTNSSHSQGAGTFNVKGVINQYSQGSGSGLIFDCDFGRLTGYSDDANVSNGTNLSACLAHSTTDWTSSSSNTPISVNNGTFQYRVGFGGYMEGISNGGRVSVGAGSGVPAMSDKLNTANMTIETWCWYDGDGREVIVSRYGGGFPNNFNMIADPNGQFHYNSSGSGAGSGNVSGEHFPDKTWHHHLWQYESGVHRWYINGAFVNSRTGGSTVAVSSGTGFGIFSRADDYERWRGKIAIVRIYNRALTATEIKNHFELERGRFGV